MREDDRDFAISLHLSKQVLEPLELLGRVAVDVHELEVVKVSVLRVESDDSGFIHLSLEL